MPEHAIYVGRPTVWGNPFLVGNSITPSRIGNNPSVVITQRLTVELYRAHVEEFDALGWLDWSWDDLRDHDLVCWCPLDQPCHADVLLELANR